MNSKEQVFDVAIIGGGLGGLSLAILLAQKNYAVIVIEKKSYPFHKVCGEYISNESFDFLVRLGIPIGNMTLPRIHKVEITGIHGQLVSEEMSLGGFGISRYTLDKLLSEKASALGVVIQENTICTKYTRQEFDYEISTTAGNFLSKFLVGGFGRHAFGNFFKPAKESENWIGAKYHLKYDFPSDKIALHTFTNGYCGISKIENDSYCLCYLAKASLLKKYKGNIDKMQQAELFQNPFLKEIFTKAHFIFDKPITISNVTFDVKKPVDNHIFYVGDSAGAIAPLTGNGMSNAMRSAWLLCKELDAYFKQKISIIELENNYSKEWNTEFKKRIRKGRLIQYFFCNPLLTSFFMSVLQKSRWIRQEIIRQTHGKPF